MKIHSKIAAVFLLIALLVLLAGVPQLLQELSQLEAARYPDYPVRDQTAEMVMVLLAWTMEPVYISMSAFIIEFLERIWNELRRRNEAHD